MNLTICLWTKGREKFLDEILESIESALIDPAVRFLIIDNGAPPPVSKKLRDWQQLNSNSGDLVRYSANEPRPSIFWQELRSRGVDWVVFPSDDDVFRPEILNEWKSTIAGKPWLRCFASSAILINENSEQTGEILTPTAFGDKTTVDQVASAFHHPPFVWPALFLRATSIPLEMPNSRFAFDWWIGLHLLIAGEVAVTKSIGINYRVHPEQESFAAPLRRKYFEAQVWLNDLVQSVEFKNWVRGLGDSEKVRFWSQLVHNVPVYGDPIFSKPVLASIYAEIIKSCKSPETSQNISNEYALLNGVFLRNGEAKHFIHETNTSQIQMSGNIRSSLVHEVCSELREATLLFAGDSIREEIILSCEHSKSNPKGVKIECSRFIVGNSTANADLILTQLTEIYQNRGDFNFTLTGGERLVINILRAMKHRIPISVIRKLQRKKQSLQM